MNDEFKTEYLSPGAGAPVNDTFKIEYWALGGYPTKAYVSWLDEGETARGRHKHSDDPVYVRWTKALERWVEEEPSRIIAEYVLKRMGHCGDCERVQGYQDDPWAKLPPCDCAYKTVEGLFAELTVEGRP